MISISVRSPLFSFIGPQVDRCDFSVYERSREVMAWLISNKGPVVCLIDGDENHYPIIANMLMRVEEHQASHEVRYDIQAAIRRMEKS
jgi:hypothetical protein